MGKIKKLLMSALACVGVLGCAAVVGSKVEAASYELGSYKVSTKTNANDTAIWDFTGNTKGQTLSTGDDVLGIICDTTNGTIKVASGYFDPYTHAKDTTKSGAEFYIPVPANSAGKVTMEASGDNADRVAYLNNDSSRKIQNISAAKVTKNPGDYDVTEDYTATDISTDPTVGGKKYEGTYLRFVVYSTDPAKTKKEFKTNRIIVELSNGSFEATAKLVNVTYMDGSTALKVEEVESGKTSSYSPKNGDMI